MLQSSKQSCTLMHCILGGRTNAHSQSGSRVEATFGAASACGSSRSGLFTLRESAVEVEFSGFAGTEEEKKKNMRRQGTDYHCMRSQDILYTSG